MPKFAPAFTGFIIENIDGRTLKVPITSDWEIAIVYFARVNHFSEVIDFFYALYELQQLMEQDKKIATLRFSEIIANYGVSGSKALNLSSEGNAFLNQLKNKINNFEDPKQLYQVKADIDKLKEIANQLLLNSLVSTSSARPKTEKLTFIHQGIVEDLDELFEYMFVSKYKEEQWPDYLKSIEEKFKFSHFETRLFMENILDKALEAAQVDLPQIQKAVNFFIEKVNRNEKEVFIENANKKIENYIKAAYTGFLNEFEKIVKFDRKGLAENNSIFAKDLNSKISILNEGLDSARKLDPSDPQQVNSCFSNMIMLEKLQANLNLFLAEQLSDLIDSIKRTVLYSRGHYYEDRLNKVDVRKKEKYQAIIALKAEIDSFEKMDPKKLTTLVYMQKIHSLKVLLDAAINKSELVQVHAVANAFRLFFGFKQKPSRVNADLVEVKSFYNRKA